MSKRIMIIEPSPTLNKILGVHFQLADHLVVSFATYGLANHWLPAFQNQHPDLIFISLHPSQPEGSSLLKRLRQHYTNAALIAMVGQEDRTNRTLQQSIQEAQAHLLIKPFRIQNALVFADPEPHPQKQCSHL